MPTPYEEVARVEREGPAPLAEPVPGMSERGRLHVAVVVPPLKDDLVPLFEKANDESAVAARLQSGVLGQLKSCNGLWCEFSGKGFSGWIKQERLWGVYPDEKVE